MDLRNEFSWSKSRSKKFADCKRLYWFDTYGKWGGWDVAAPERTREIYLLSHLKSRHMWAGDVVHVAVANILRAYRDGELLDPQTLVAGLRDQMRRDYRDSHEGKYRTGGKPKCCALREHEYQETVSKAEWERVVSKAERCLGNFVASDLFNKLKRVRTQDWLAIDEPKPLSFLVRGTKVWVRLDAAYRSPEGLHIIDWKTGSSEDELGPLQLAVYSMFASQEWLKEERLPIFVGLCDLSGEVVSHAEVSITPAEVLEAERHVAADVEAMAALLESSREENRAREDKYPGTDAPRICHGCNFLRICPVSPSRSAEI